MSMKGGFLCVTRQEGLAASKQEHSARPHIDRHQDHRADALVLIEGAAGDVAPEGEAFYLGLGLLPADALSLVEQLRAQSNAPARDHY
jgi:hypothetical protein